MTKQEKRRRCCGSCEDNFYNGNNPFGVQECWHLEDAAVVERRFIPIWQMPPHHQKPEETLSCHRRKGYMAYE